MRIITTALVRRAFILIAALALVPQFAFAQLPVETRELKLQGASSGSLIMKTAATTTAYTLTYPNAIGSVGSFMYISATDGSLAWSNAPTATGYVPRWNGSAIEWIDPNGANNPNWSINGNALTGTGTFGTTTSQGINVKTNGSTRINLASDGAITINGTTEGGATTTIGRSAGHTTTIDGTTNVNGTTTITGTTNVNVTGSAVTTIGNTGANATVAAGTLTVNATTTNITSTTNVTGTTTITGTTSINSTGTAVTNIGNTSGGTAFTGPITVDGSSGTSGYVLVSQGANTTPQWQSVGSAIGIRQAGRVQTAGTFATPTAATTVTISSVILQGTDAIIVTLDGGNSAIVTNVSTRTNSTDQTTADGSFVVSLSASYTGYVNYLVIKNQ